MKNKELIILIALVLLLILGFGSIGIFSVMNLGTAHPHYELLYTSPYAAGIKVVNEQDCQGICRDFDIFNNYYRLQGSIPRVANGNPKDNILEVPFKIQENRWFEAYHYNPHVSVLLNARTDNEGPTLNAKENNLYSNLTAKCKAEKVRIEELSPEFYAQYDPNQNHYAIICEMDGYVECPEGQCNAIGGNPEVYVQFLKEGVVCINNTCDGFNYCKENEWLIIPGKCGVECINIADCENGEICQDYKCVEENICWKIQDNECIETSCPSEYTTLQECLDELGIICPEGFIYNATTDKCERYPDTETICLEGTYNPLTGKCEVTPEISKLDLNEIWEDYKIPIIIIVGVLLLLLLLPRR